MQAWQATRFLCPQQRRDISPALLATINESPDVAARLAWRAQLPQINVGSRDGAGVDHRGLSCGRPFAEVAAGFPTASFSLVVTLLFTQAKVNAPSIK
jgi:hypothetical protein